MHICLPCKVLHLIYSETMHNKLYFYKSFLFAPHRVITTCTRYTTLIHSVLATNSSDYLCDVVVFAKETNSHKHIYECACTDPSLRFFFNFQYCHIVIATQQVLIQTSQASAAHSDRGN